MPKRFTSDNLYNECIKGNLEAVSNIVANGCSPKIITYSDGDDAYSPLSVASINGHVNIVEFLLDNGCNINTKYEIYDEEEDDWYNNIYQTALGYAVKYRRVSVVKLLLRRGALIGNALIDAAYEGFTDIVMILIAHGADVNADNIFYSGNSFPLLEAIKKGHVEVIRVLLAAGVDINKTLNKNKTALDIAKHLGKTDIVQIIVRHRLRNLFRYVFYGLKLIKPFIKAQDRLCEPPNGKWYLAAEESFNKNIKKF